MTCARCHRTLTTGYQLIQEIDGFLESIIVGRECRAWALAAGWELPQKVASP